MRARIRWALVPFTFLLAIHTVAWARGEKAQALSREVDFAYYSLHNGFRSTLFLVDNSSMPIDFVLAIHGRSGQTLESSTQTVAPQQQTSIDLGSLLQSSGADVNGDFSEGSVTVLFSSPWPTPLAGQINISNPILGLSSESDMVRNDPGATQIPSSLNALWWNVNGNRDAQFMVTNVSAGATAADVYLDFAGQRHSTPVLYFAPHEMKTLSVAALLDSLGETPERISAGGITIAARGTNPTLVAQGMIADPGTGFSTSLHFLNPDRQLASALHANGLPLGTPTKDSPYAGAGVFIPHVIVRNLSSADQTVTLTVEYTTSTGIAQTALPPITLAGLSTQDISLADFPDLLPLPLPFVSIRIQYSGAPGTVVAEAASVETRGRTVISSSVVNEGDGQTGAGSYPWQADTGYRSYLFLTSMGEKTARIGFEVQAKGVPYYLTNLKLAPHETRPIDLGALRDQQQEDFRRNRIPANATDGTVSWTRLDNVPVMGRLVVVSNHRAAFGGFNKRGTGVVGGTPGNPPTANIVCQDCFCPCPASYDQLAMIGGCDLLPGASCQLFATGAYVDCNGNLTYYDDTGDSDWESSNTSVATVGNGASGGLVTGVAPGATDVSSSFGDNAYTAYLPCNSFVRVFTPVLFLNVFQLSCTSVTRGQQTTCTINPLVPSGATVSNWTFKDNANNTVTAPSNTNGTWSGIAVMSGKVSVNLTLSSGRVLPLSAQLNVSARSGWAFPGVSATKVQNNTNGFSLPSPPTGGNEVGASQLRVAWNPQTFKIGDNGPNNGFNYVTGINDTSVYQYVISPDLENTSSAFYTHQCGNYNASTYPNGYISGATLLANTTHHESQRGSNSHYDQYMTSQGNSSNNLMTAAESFVEGPSVPIVTFSNNDLPNQLNSKATVILNATAVENCHGGDMAYDASCAFQGYVNVANAQGNYQPCP